MGKQRTVITATKDGSVLVALETHVGVGGSAKDRKQECRRQEREVPDYSKPIKRWVREVNVRKFRELTGHQTIPTSRGYWTLCNLQDYETAEIEQMKELGLIDESQFFGVDLDEAIIKRNRAAHPDAHWYAGEWTKVIRLDEFNPAMVYLDTTSVVDLRVAIRLVTETMLLCPPDTVLFANVMWNFSYQDHVRHDSDLLIEQISRKVPASELSQWELKVENYSYHGTSYTEMLTYILHKP